MVEDSGFKGIKGLKDCDPEHEAAILLDLAKYHDERAIEAEARRVDLVKKDDEKKASEAEAKRADHLSAARGCREKAAWWLQQVKKTALP